MTDLIQTVADLIEERDREGLEATLARVFFDLSGARALTLWRVHRRADGAWLRRSVGLPAGGDAGGGAGGADLPLADAPGVLRLACESRNVERARARPGRPIAYALPLQGADEVLGLIEIVADGEIDRERINLLTGMLRIYRSHLAALDYGDVDELTRLANRRSFDDQFRRFLLAEARRNGAKRLGDVWGARSHIGVADIDFFKQINDRFGHPYGDEVLMLFAERMRGAFRDGDRLFRFGGEEFVVLMQNASLDDALAAFERFRAAVADYPFPRVGQVTVSVGVTSLKLHDTGSAAFGRADQALYVAKRRGRNRVLLFEGLDGAAGLKPMRPASPGVELF
jgi:diguanylate cyclase (GGDEF)-like protein